MNAEAERQVTHYIGDACYPSGHRDDLGCDYCGAGGAVLVSPIEDAFAYAILACWQCAELMEYLAGRSFERAGFEDWRWWL